MIQRSFSSGEVDPALYGRADVDRWKAALKECKNWIVQPEGGMVVRQGFELKARIPYTASAFDILLMPFEYGPSDSYVQVAHNGICNVVRNGTLLRGAATLSGSLDKGVTPFRVTNANNLLTNGDYVKFSTGTLAGNTYQISGATVFPTVGAGFNLVGTVATAGVESVSYAATLVSGLQPIAEFSFQTIEYNSRYVQSGDVQFISAYPYPRKFTRLYEASGSLDRENFNIRSEIVNGYPTVYSVASLAVVSSGGAGTEYIRYRVTVSNRDGEESAVIRNTAITAASISGTTTITVTTTAAHGLLTNDSIYMTLSLNDDAGTQIYKAGDVVRVVVTGANTFTVSGNGSTTTTGAFIYQRISATMGPVNTPSSSNYATISWSSVPGAASYNVYREFGRVYGYIGSTSDTSFIDRGIIPDQKDTPVIGISPMRWQNTNGSNYPSAVGLFQQRLIWANFLYDSERIVSSHVGNYEAYDPGAEDASGIDFGLAGRTVSGVKHLVEIAGRAIVLTNTSEWVLKGGTSGGLTPTAINARADSYYGCGDQIPAVIGSSLIYVQRGDRIVREAKYDFSQEALASADLTLWAKHLFTPEVKRLAYQRTSQVLWILRKDGKLLGLTYVPEQNIWGWHQHEIAGRLVHDICIVSEDGVDRLYCAILDGTYINICRLPLAWESGNVDDHIGFDMALTFDGTLAGTGTLTGGTDWTTDETLTLTASTSNFVAGDVDKVFLLRLGDESVYVTCTGYTSGTVISVTPNTIVPVALQGVASESIARCAQTFSGLDHLDGITVGVIADGSREPDEVVASGAITMDGWFARVQAGIKIVSDARTLDLEPDDKDTYLGDFKHVTRVYLRVKDTRGLKVGLDAAYLEEFMPQYNENVLVNATPTLQSGPVEVLMDATHEALGSVLIRQDTGLPATVLNARPVFNTGELK